MREWWLIHTKPKQELKALANLQAQGFECYLPLMPVQTLRRGNLTIKQQVLFPRYLFARPGTDAHSENWGVIRSTLGVNRLVSFGAAPAKVSNDLVQLIVSGAAERSQPKAKFTPGDILVIDRGPFAGIEAVFDMVAAEDRVMVLINLMSQQVRLGLPPGHLRTSPHPLGGQTCN